MNPRILVVGDAILDRYLHGTVERVNPEGPGIVFRVQRTENRLGGAGAVACLCAGLGCDTTLLASIGKDESGSAIESLCRQSGIRRRLFLSDQNTTVKERRVADGRLLNDRTDFDSFDPWHENTIAGCPWAVDGEFDCILVADYGRGVALNCVPSLRKRFPTAPIIVDPFRQADWLQYEGATIIKANRDEAKGRILPRRTRLIVTLGERGMKLDGRLIAGRAVKPIDVCGAGDTVSAVLGWSIGRGRSLRKACRLANAAAALQVCRLGVQQIGPEEIEPASICCDAVGIAKSARAAGKTIVFTNGCFDVLHAGHVQLLQRAKDLGDVLIVGLNDDASVRRLKGESRPIHSQEDRTAVLAALACVDAVAIFSGEPMELIEAIRPDVLVKGEDYRGCVIAGAEFAGRVELLPIVAGLSSTAAIEALA